MFSVQLQYKVPFLSVFTSWVTFLGHLSNGLDDPQQMFFTNAKILTFCLVGLRRKQFYFFYIGAIPSHPYFQRIGKNFTVFFFFHWTRKLRLNYLPLLFAQIRGSDADLGGTLLIESTKSNNLSSQMLFV